MGEFPTLGVMQRLAKIEVDKADKEIFSLKQRLTAPSRRRAPTRKAKTAEAFAPQDGRVRAIFSRLQSGAHVSRCSEAHGGAAIPRQNYTARQAARAAMRS